MTNAIRVHAQGGPEVLSWEVVDLPDPHPAKFVCAIRPSEPP